MNTSLLSCLRGAGQRLRLVLAEKRRRRPVRSLPLQPIRAFSALTTMPLFWPVNVVFYLSSYPRANTKSAAVFNELVAAGVPENAFWFPPEGGDASWHRLARLLVRWPWALGVLVKLKRRSHRLDNIDLHIVLGRESFRRTLRRLPRLMPIIISDVSPEMHMLWSAAALEGNRAIWWQDDFHHHFWLPYDIRAAAILNEPGLVVAKARGTAQVIAARSTKPPLPLRALPEDPVIAVATNVAFEATAAQKELLRDVAARLGVKKLELRLHPNSRLAQGDFTDAPIILARSDEPMEAFAARVDLVVVGNTAAQLWLIRNGVQVVHIEGLDFQGYDLYGYVKKRFVFGTENLFALSLAAIRSFYEQSPEVADRIRRYTTVSDSHNLRGLEHLADLLAGSLRTGLTTRQHE